MFTEFFEEMRVKLQQKDLWWYLLKDGRIELKNNIF